MNTRIRDHQLEHPLPDEGEEEEETPREYTTPQSTPTAIT